MALLVLSSSVLLQSSLSGRGREIATSTTTLSCLELLQRVSENLYLMYCLVKFKEKLTTIVKVMYT